jgi:hypothetical protein
VSFSIGAKYRDNVWCDVVDVETCHLLLGKPWKYDKATIHDETKNTYNFMMGKTKLTLLHSPWVEPKPSQGDGQSIVAKQELTDKESSIKGVVLGLINEQLGRFVNIVQVELPKEVPSLRDIQPQLDSVPESNVPNHPYDIKSPKRLEELGKQMEEIERVFMSSLGILMACGKSKAQEKHDKSTQQRNVWGRHDNHQGIPMMRSITLIMRCYLVFILRKGEWNKLIGHPKDRGKNQPNSRTNSLQQWENDTDCVTVSLFNFPFRIRIGFSLFH